MQIKLVKFLHIFSLIHSGFLSTYIKFNRKVFGQLASLLTVM
jgi:hypothetical protein